MDNDINGNHTCHHDAHWSKIMKLNIYDILFWIFFLLSVILFIWIIFGNSPTFEQALLVLILGVLLKMQSKNSALETRLIMLEKSFSHLANDFKQHVKHK